jgi:ComF family protein
MQEVCRFAARRLRCGLDGRILVPMPLGKKRRRGRGYNQAQILAHELAAGSGAKLLLHLERARETAPQVGRRRDERRQNLEGAFRWTGSGFSAEDRLVLVDDVCTTGATLGAAAEALRRAGAGAVDAIVLAVAG